MCKTRAPRPPHSSTLTRMGVGALFSFASFGVNAQLYGLVIGEPITAAECPRVVMPAVKNFEPPYAPVSSVCTMSKGRAGFLAFPASAPPQHIMGTRLGFRLDGDKLDVLFGTTQGVAVQDSVVADLSARFGAPATRVDETVTTAAGAVLRAVRAHWKLPNARIEYLGVAGRADAGELVLGTPDGIARFREEQRRAGAATVTPM